MPRSTAGALFEDGPRGPPPRTAARQRLADAVEKHRRHGDRLGRLRQALEHVGNELAEVHLSIGQREEIVEQAQKAATKRKNAALIGDPDPFPGLLVVVEADGLLRQAQLRRRELDEQGEALRREIGPGRHDCALALVATAAEGVRRCVSDVLDEDGALDALAEGVRGRHWVIDVAACAVFLHLSRENLLPSRFMSDANFANSLRHTMSNYSRALPADDAPPLVRQWQAAIARLQGGDVDAPLPLPGE
jgi:hypothetical protein